VTGTIIAVIGVSLMRVGIGWAMGGPPFLAKIADPANAGRMIANPAYAALDNLAIALFVLCAILLIAKFGRGFIANISVLLGIILGGIVAAALGKMSFGKVANAHWFDVVLPFSFGAPVFDPVLIATMVLVMIVTFIESTGMFLALSDLTGRPLTPRALTAGLRTDGLGTVIGGVFNTFPYTSFSQNVGLVGVTGVRSRFVCVAGGLILIGLGLIPKMAALVESLPQFVLGGAGLVMFGMVAATGIRILSNVDYKTNRNNLYIVAVSISAGMIPLVAPAWTQHMAHGLHPLLESGILLTTVAAVLLNMFFNGAGDAASSAAEAKVAALQAEGGH
jgi:NCS2 family nucleobase:cation symporter-2